MRCHFGLRLPQEDWNESGFRQQSSAMVEQMAPMKETKALNDLQDFLLDLWNDEAMDEELDSFVTETLEAKCEKVDPAMVANKQSHLTPLQRKELVTLLSKHDELFNGKLGDK